MAATKEGSSDSAARSWAQRSWSLYNLLLLIRVCIAPVLVGYVHPDEFFQGGQELWFGCPPSRPWEFEPEHAIRSIVPPTIMTWWPLHLYSNAFGISMDQLSGMTIWVIPRVACSLYAILAVDMSVWALARSGASAQQRGVPLPVLVVASAWPTFVLLGRPFTNAMETWILALLFRIVVSDGRRITSTSTKPTVPFRKCFAVGFLCAIGIFTRFTFVAFALPIVVYFGWTMIRRLGFFGWLVKPALTYFVFLVVVGNLMDRDTQFYGSSAATLTPWNAFLYNSQVKNLQEHGLHPRWTHAVVNMLILYGPMTLMGYVLLGMPAYWVVQTPTRRNRSAETEDPVDASKARIVVTLCKWIILCGLGVLSLAPHQEPRFLLPLLVPLALLTDNPWTHRYEGLLSKIWLSFNVALLLFFGFLHQGGVVPSLLAMGSSLADKNPSAVIFYHTFMPPTFLSRLAGSTREHSCRGLPIIDLDGSKDLAALQASLLKELPCGEVLSGKPYVHILTLPGGDTLDGEVWFFGPGWCDTPGYSCESIWSHSPHLSTEDFPSVDSVLRYGLPLSTYEISCKS